ncbi:MAG: hypothetical protein M3Z05_16335 [Gemmatimonadota bacterium]|nr:hypothetical protein [Gemmatimonadota bacterium]
MTSLPDITPSPLARALPQNRLLTALAIESPDDAAWLQQQLVHVDLVLGHMVAAAGEPFTAVYFPVTAVMSVISHMMDGGSAEVGTVGNEGAVGVRAHSTCSPTIVEP